MSDYLIAFVVKTMGFPPEAMQDLVDLIAQGSFLVRSGLSEHMSTVVRDMHTHTWYTEEWRSRTSVRSGRRARRSRARAR